MHCDDKRTASVLRENIAESARELARLAEEHQNAGKLRRRQIRQETLELERFIAENKEQIEAMG